MQVGSVWVNINKYNLALVTSLFKLHWFHSVYCRVKQHTLWVGLEESEHEFLLCDPCWCKNTDAFQWKTVLVTYCAKEGASAPHIVLPPVSPSHFPSRHIFWERCHSISSQNISKMPFFRWLVGLCPRALQEACESSPPQTVWEGRGGKGCHFLREWKCSDGEWVELGFPSHSN